MMREQFFESYTGQLLPLFNSHASVQTHQETMWLNDSLVLLANEQHLDDASESEVQKRFSVHIKLALLSFSPLGPMGRGTGAFTSGTQVYDVPTQFQCF